MKVISHQPLATNVLFPYFEKAKYYQDWQMIGDEIRIILINAITC
jgi:hypothetical protein